MFSEIDGSRKTIGDVDIIYHDGLYHLFHLVLPNHDFIAHAISDNAINWRRVDNAVFIDHPGGWDDLMLWTMHVSADPYRPGRWRMFYTGLTRRDGGKIQRIGLAYSDDLYRWVKSSVDWVDHRGPHDPAAIKTARDALLPRGASAICSPANPESCFPLESNAQFYESDLDEGRHWISFRDPYYFRDGDRGYLLAAARVPYGPIVRRGAVALYTEESPERFIAGKPLFHPGLYDDVEVPNLIRLEDEYYLIGSIREDAKIRYWHAKQLDGPWRSYYDNVLLAAGNYAGRICRDDAGYLLWNFYTSQEDRTARNLTPPPKRLVRQDDGLLRAQTFEYFDACPHLSLPTRPLRPLRSEADELCEQRGLTGASTDGSHVELISHGPFQPYVFSQEVESFRLRCQMRLDGYGKCGLLFRIDPASHDGYYLSLDLMKGVAQLRAWGTGTPGGGELMMQFRQLQASYYMAERRGEASIDLIGFGSYLELSINGRVVLSLADDQYVRGYVGVYVETAVLRLSDLQLWSLENPTQNQDQLSQGWHSE